MKNNIILLNLFVLLVMNNINGQNTSSVAGNDYVLRSCVSSVELIRNHRKTAPRIDTIQTTEGKSKKNSPEETNVNRVINNRQLNSNARAEKDRNNYLPGRIPIISDSPVKTVNIMRQRKSEPLVFRRKNGFPEASQQTDRRSKKKSEIITIKSIN